MRQWREMGERLDLAAHGYGPRGGRLQSPASTTVYAVQTARDRQTCHDRVRGAPVFAEVPGLPHASRIPAPRRCLRRPMSDRAVAVPVYRCPTVLFRPDLQEVAIERSIEYCMLSIGLSARRALLIGFGVTARMTALPGWAARRTLRGISSLEKKPT